MSLLQSVANSWAFSERPMGLYEIHNLYVPFSEISSDNPESILNIVRQTNHFYLIEGHRGVGKSSFLRYLTSQLYESDTFTLLLDSFGNSDYTDPNTLAKWIIGSISRAVDIYLHLDPSDKEEISKIIAEKVKLSKGEESNLELKMGGWFSIIPQILRFESSVGVGIKDTADTYIEKKYFLDDRVSCINELLSKITTEGGFSNATILIDGIDHMDIDDIELLAKRNFPWLTQLNASILLSSLSSYRENPLFHELVERARIIQIPKLNTEDSLIRFLNKRVKALDSEKEWVNVCNNQATRLLFEWYESDPNRLPLRKLIRSINYAATYAITDGKDIILPYHMSTGIRDCL